MPRKFNPIDAHGFDLGVDEIPLTFRDHFIVPPFSVLDARMAEWQTRKKAWLSIGIQSELGRGENTLKFSKTASKGFAEFQKGQLSHKEKATLYKSQDRLNEIMAQRRNGVHKSNRGLAFNSVPDYNNKGGFSKMSGTSIFDPVLCEVVYNWWVPKGGHILDPFAGGSVRGLVASATGFQYTGVELRKEQVEANQIQWGVMKEKKCFLDKPEPVWIAGDSMEVRGLAPGKYDMVFSCPPYADLEVYSKDPSDISNHEYEDFLLKYRHIIRRSCSMLKNNRFACFVVGEVRNKKTGFYRNFVNDTIQAFEDIGLHYYNEAILITMIGSLPIRAGAHFRNWRKLGRTHQNVLVFLKGDDPTEIKTLFSEKEEVENDSK